MIGSHLVEGVLEVLPSLEEMEGLPLHRREAREGDRPCRSPTSGIDGSTDVTHARDRTACFESTLTRDAEPPDERLPVVIGCEPGRVPHQIGCRAQRTSIRQPLPRPTRSRQPRHHQQRRPRAKDVCARSSGSSTAAAIAAWIRWRVERDTSAYTAER